MRAAVPVLAALAALAALTIAGCGTIQNQVEPVHAIVQLEVWNRTLDDIFLIDDRGRVLNVPSCGHSASTPMDLDNVQVRMDAGRIANMSAGGSPGPWFLTFTASGDMTPTTVRPVAFPACVGHPTVTP